MLHIKRICSQIQKHKFTTTLWTEDGEKIKKQTPQYFYFLNKHYDYFEQLDACHIFKTNKLSLDGYELYKAVMTNPYEYSKFVKAHKSKIYQSDIPFELKYINDNNLQISSKRHVLFYDIESKPDDKDEDATKVQKAKSPITSIACYSNVLKNHYVFAWHPVHTKGIPNVQVIKKQDSNKVFILCKDQEQVLLAFTEFVKSQGVDIIIGYFSHGYDLPYICKRLAKNSISLESLSQNGNLWMSNYPFDGVNYKFKIAGLDTLDMMDCLSYMFYTFRDNKLDTVAEELLGTQHMKLKNVSWRDWEDRFFEFIE